MRPSAAAFLRNLIGALYFLLRYKDLELFAYRLHYALTSASLAKKHHLQLIKTAGLRFFVRNPLEAVMVTTKHEGRLLEQFRLKKGGVFLDVGAHIGEYALRGVIHGMTVRCWEPDPENRAVLLLNFAANGLHAEVHSEALGETEGILPFYLSGEQSSFNPRSGPIMEARVRTLDSYAFDWVDLIKIDTEGYEAKVLAGAKATISRCRPRVIVELHPFYAPNTEAACVALLRGMDYARVSSFTHGGTKYLIGWGD